MPKKLTIEEFITKSKKIHEDKYDYSQSIYVNNHTEIKIICPIHGIFYQNAKIHQKGHGCPFCKSSKGELAVIKFLTNNKIIFKQQYKFKGCTHRQSLHFDFYLTKLNTCVEYDGIQHFEPSEYFGGEATFKNRQIRDKIKNEYCQKNNIRLIRIRYDENVDDVLSRELLKN